ncbi:MAG: PorT family protein [Prevotella sp.]|jgi:hypothetical protein|nr:PorT family protein [Prevotella sp.]
MKTFVRTICCITIILLSGSNVNAQESVARFGVKAGMNYSGSYGDDNSPKSKAGINIGITLDFRLSSDIYLLTGLDYSVKGGKGKPYEITDNDGRKFMLTQTDKPVYLQLPLHAGYKFDVPDFKIMPHAGFYMAYGVGGKAEYKYEPLDGGAGSTSKIDFFGVGIGKFDYGAGIGVNTEYRKFVLDLGYDWGLREFAKDFGNGKGKAKSGYLTLGYKF